MKVRITIAVSAASLMTVGSVVVWRGLFSRDRVAVGVPVSKVAGIGEASTAQRSGGTEVPIPERTIVGTAAGASQADGDQKREGLAGRVLSSIGSPVVGAMIDVVRKEPDANDLQNSDGERASLKTLGRAVSDDQGEFFLPLLGRGAISVYASAKGYARQILQGRDPSEFLTVRLNAASTVFGQITRASDGAAVKAARVQIYPCPETDEDAIHSCTNLSGDYRIEGVPPGRVRLAVIPEEEVPELANLIDLAAGELVHKDIVVKDGISVTGTVTDALKGVPIEGALVGCPLFAKTTRTNRRGEFALKGLRPEKYVLSEIFAQARGYGLQERHFEGSVLGSIELDFTLLPGRRVQGRVVDRVGEAIADTYVAATSREATDEANEKSDSCSGRSGADGRFTLEDLRRDVRHVMRASKEGYGAVAYDFPLTESSLDCIDLGDIVLPTPCRIEGIVVNAQGEAMPRVGVWLAGANTDRFRYSKRPDAAIAGNQQSRKVTTDEHGAFHFEELAPGEYGLVPDVKRLGMQVFKVRIEQGEQRKHVEIKLRTGYVIQGVVTDPKNDQMPTLIVQAIPEWLEGYGTGATVTDGTFRLEGLDSGKYTVVAFPLSDEQTERRVYGTLSGVEAGTRDLQIVLKEEAQVSGIVLKPSGEPASGAWLRGIYRRNKRMMVFSGTFSDAQGQFRLGVPPGSVISVLATLSEDSQGQSPQREREFNLEGMVEDVAAGQSDIVVKMSTTNR